MSADGPCSVVRGGGGGMRGFDSGSSVFSSRDHAHQQQAVRFGVAFAAPAAPATASSAAWDANDEPLPDILSGPVLRSVSSLVMSIDAEEGVSSSAAARNSTNSGGTNKNTNNSSSSSGGGAAAAAAAAAAANNVAVSGAMGSKMVDMLMTPLPPPPVPMNTTDRLTREQSFPPPFRTRLGRDQSFPPMDMLPSSSSLRPEWPAVPTSNGNNSGGGSMVVGGLFAGTGGAPSLSKFPQGLDYQGTPSPPLPWGGPDQDGPGGQVHRGGGNGGPSLGNEGQHGVYYDPPPPSSSRQRHPSFDKLAEMIPGIPHWTTPSSPSASSSPSAGAPVGGARELPGGGGGDRGSTEVEGPGVLSPASASRTTPSARGRQQQQQHSTSARPSDKKLKKQLRLRADSPSRPHWSPSAASPPPATAGTKRPQASGTGKRSVEPPLSCGPVRAGGGPVDVAQLERRRVKIQRYLYKRSRRKFAKSTRDASPSRSRPKAAAKRPRVKGKFVKTAPDFVSVSDRQPREGPGGMDTGDQLDAATATPPSPPSPPSPAVGGAGIGTGVGGEGRRGGGGGFGGGGFGDGGFCGGGVRSVRDGGSVNINLNNRKAFSSAPPSSLLPRGVGGGARLPPVSALAPNDGAPNAFLWSTDPMSMAM